MEDFLRFFDKKVETFPMHLEITYNKTMDWVIKVYKKGCAKDYPKSMSIKDDAIICMTEGCDMELAFAQAHVQLKEWLNEFNGGY